MRPYGPLLAVGSALVLLACSSDTSSGSSRPVRTPVPMMPTTPMAMTPPAAGTGSGFGNPMPMMPRAGSGGAAPQAMPMPRANCKGGLYLGTYSCNVNFMGFDMPLAGDVSFTLEIDETVVPGECDSEFCPDLVIAEGSGTLFGLAGLTGFEAKLDGGLDCQSGEFRATAPNGVYGIAGPMDPNDPDSLWTVFDPAFGAFMGTLAGMYGSGPPERIAGDWDLADPSIDARCAGPFMVELQP